MLLLSWGVVPLLSNLSNDNALAGQVVSNHIRSLMANHLTDIASSDRHTVKPWFSGKLDFSPRVRDFSANGFVLIGGRLDYLNNQTVAALVYRRREHFINVFIWPSAADRVGIKSLNQQGYNMLFWTRAGMHYWAVSELSAGELREFVNLIQGD